jgi:hypothetical protein
MTAACGLFLLASSPAPALAQVKGKGKKDIVVDVFGEPKGFKAGEPARYALWASKTGWHVRTTTAKKLHHFTGKIRVEGGVITGLEAHDLEYKGKFGDWWRISEKRHEITIDFKTDRHIDGINFQVSKEAQLIFFNLYIDGKHHADKIFVGKAGHHPERDPFEALAHPIKK